MDEESTLAHDSSSWPWAGHFEWEKSHFDWTNFGGARSVGTAEEAVAGEKQTSVISGSLGRGFHSGHLAAGLCGSRETGGNWRDFRDSSYPHVAQSFAC